MEDDKKINSIFSELSIYEILGINKNANEEEIKKAYKYLVLKYHPDKNKDKNTTEDFIKIQSAYEIAIDKKLREEYDNMQNKDKNIFHKKRFEENMKKSINRILTFFCKDEKYLYNIEKNKYDIAIDYLIRKYVKNEKKNNLDIIDNVDCELIDRYNDNYMLIEIKRKSRNNITLCVPLRNDINIFYNDGEMDKYGNKGDLILHTKTINNYGYYCKNGDMFKEIKMNNSNNNSDNSETIMYYHIDGNEITINKKELIENKYIIFNGLGLPKCDSSKRGDLICEFIS